jgi:hypothetical protein
MSLRLVAVVLAAAACKVPAVDYTGKACPCPNGYACDLATTTCTRGAGGSDAGGDGAADAGDASDGKAQTYYQAVIADSPLAYWRLGDSGTTAKDEMGTYDGTYVGTCSKNELGAIAGDPNTAVQFDGSTCQVTLPDALEFLNTDPYSVEAWIEETAAVTAFRVVYSKESRMTGPEDGYALVDTSNGVYFERAVNHSAPTTAPAPHALDAYVHLVGVYDGTHFVLYLNGQAGTPVANAVGMPSYSADALIGADLDGDHFNGLIDEVAVYNHPLSAARVQLHYDLGTGASGGGD